MRNSITGKVHGHDTNKFSSKVPEAGRVTEKILGYSRLHSMVSKNLLGTLHNSRRSVLLSLPTTK